MRSKQTNVHMVEQHVEDCQSAEQVDAIDAVSLTNMICRRIHAITMPLYPAAA
jgi:hypothetical protein